MGMKYCEFLEDIYDGVELVWSKGRRYPVTYEDETGYYFGDPITHGVFKTDEHKIYIVRVFENRNGILQI